MEIALWMKLFKLRIVIYICSLLDFRYICCFVMYTYIWNCYLKSVDFGFNMMIIIINNYTYYDYKY